MSTELSEWDEGDAYTLTEIGVLASRSIKAGLIVIGEAEAPNATIVIRLHQCSEGMDAEHGIP